MKGLWPPLLGWIPWGICACGPDPYYFGPHGKGWFMLPIAFLTSLIAAPFCVANFVRLPKRRETSVGLVRALVLFNLSFFPVGPLLIALLAALLAKH